jgi:hypothetical protein
LVRGSSGGSLGDHSYPVAELSRGSPTPAVSWAATLDVKNPEATSALSTTVRKPTLASVLHVSYVDNQPTLGTICVAMTRTALVVAVSLFAGCAAPTPPPADPAQAGDGHAPVHAPSGKRAACTFGADQTCNEDPRVSALWGRCTEHGTCECNAGFELGPSGYCRSQQRQQK